MDQLNVAIVGGTGNLGSALALRLGAPGVKIIIGSRDAEKAKNAVATLKPKLRAGELVGTTNREAVKDADFVVIAVPYEGHAQMVSDLQRARHVRRHLRSRRSPRGLGRRKEIPARRLPGQHVQRVARAGPLHPRDR